MKNIGIIPARSGSKGLKNKNIKGLNGKPLIAYSIEAAIESGVFDEVHLSTDSKEYAQIGRKYGASVLFLRDTEFATDKAGSWDAVRFVLKEYEKRNKDFDMVTLLQPTSPLRTTEDIKNSYKIFLEKELDSLISVCEVEHSPYLMYSLTDEGTFKNINKEKIKMRRQDLETFYRINGAIYMTKTSIVADKKDIVTENTYAYIMEQENSIDIDTALDFKIAEVLLREQRTKQGE